MKKIRNNYFANKRLLFFEAFIVLLVFGVLFIWSLDDTPEKKNLSKTETVEKNIKDVFFNEKKTRKDLESLMDAKMIGEFHVIGKDSFLRIKPKTSLVDSYDRYIDKYASIVEGKYLKTTYKTHEDPEGNVYVSMKPWYFANYSSDLNTMVSLLLDLNKVDTSIFEKDIDKYEIYEYRARAKAMMILNDYLEEYDNKDEIIEMTFFYDGDKQKENQYLSLYFNLVGVTTEKYKNIDRAKQVKRLKGYLDNAIRNGIVDKNDPLRI